MPASHSPSAPGPAIRFVPNPPDLNQQSVALPGTARPGSSPIYRNALTSDCLITCSPITGARTPYEIFWRSARAHPTRPCLGHRTLIRTALSRAWSPYQWQTYADVAERITNFGSGTTGNPKGAMITHGNLASQNIMHYYRGRGHTVDDVHLSYLPLAHCYERTVALQVLGAGARIAYHRGDPTLLLDDIRAASPTVLPTVPRLLNRIYAKVRAMTIDHPGSRGALFRRAVAENTAHLESGGDVKHPLWDSLLFDVVRRSVMGDRIRVVSCGSASLHPDVQSLLRVVLACDVMQGYGTTECAAIAATQMLGETATAQIGPVFPSLECKLVDVPELGYWVADRPCAKGEICLRGPAVTVGYWKDAEKTKESIDADGWLHTGDIGAIDDRGCLAIIDRQKSLLKLAQGDYVAPEKLENTYTLSPLVHQIFVHGDSLQAQLVAIVVPEPMALVALAQSRLAIDTDDVPALCRDPTVVAAVLGALTVIGREKRLVGFEVVKAVHLEPVPWTPASGGTLTPSFKLRRPQAVAKYRAVIDALYAQLAAGPDAAVERGLVGAGPAKL
ncbi:hypothetical protein AMAG_14630 [Allomyces macrogynus ATCC 38327]|uniref:AMP-dependent synthetase/ligase domain-containing protein n=1 Tax=Allomyces macrogynus (strain ATCC 38327) TaxID=578462 RepID=A0A0L0T749_ALLM3|nr:hypothetical protein AMAG_14630 [Allomyces macrogynus ATCC 38327]|eukprot:KNE70506.1 hypothetical protein AMAG_14630 [Allomyces macrogynus ATCC 38327]